MSRVHKRFYEPHLTNQYFINGAIQKKNFMENQQVNPETALYRVYDEMACEVVLYTDDLKEARTKAYNYQSVLIDNQTDNVIYDYSC